MLRLIVIFLLVSSCWKIIYYLINTIFKHITTNNNNSKFNDQNATQALTKCTICGLYIPLSDAIFYRNDVFCCQAHAEQKKYQ